MSIYFLKVKIDFYFFAYLRCDRTTSGDIMTEDDYSAKIVEVDYKTGKEVFEATLFYKSLNGDKSNAWGQLDKLYRSERIELKY